MKEAIAGVLLSLALAACGPVGDDPTPEPQVETHTPETIGPVVTIHCTLKNVHTGNVSTGTYFTYDTRTKDMPSDELFNGSGHFIKQYERDHFKKWNSPYRLTDGVVVLPIKQRRNKFKLDLEHIWYKHGDSWHFFAPRGRFKFTANCCGIIGFGKRRKGEDVFEGRFSFLSGNAMGGTAGTWSLQGMGKIDVKNYEWGYVRCGAKQPSPDSIHIPAGLK